MLDKTPTTRLQALLDTFGAALESGRIDDAVSLFAEDCYWRDLVAFTWNLKTVEGRDQVRDMLQAQLAAAKPSNWRVAAGEQATEADGVLESWITFETATGRGYGLVRFKNGQIWTLLTALSELKGHEEKSGFTRPLGAKHGKELGAKTWKEEREEEASTLGYEKQPYTVIIGGGQGGIALGARLRQLGVPTIILEKNDRAGDSWRKRYKSLCLHDPVWYDHLPYIDFPKNWPVFAPKDKIGDWLEFYTKVMELNYWTRSTAKSAKWDEAAKEWTIVVDRDGEEVVLRPKQLVFATGMSGKANIPDFNGRDRFLGEQHHSSQHPGPDGYTGKKVVVIGSNNSAHDICAALYEAGVDVTMIQRSTTHIVKSDTLMDIGLGSLYSEPGAGKRRDDSQGRSDLCFTAIPDHARVPDPALRQDARARCGLLCGFGKGRLPAGLGYGRLRSLHEISAPRLRLLYRHRRLSAYHRRQGQACGRPSGGDHGEFHQAFGWQGNYCRRHRLCHRLRVDEWLGGRSDRSGDRRQSGQGLGPRFGHAKRSGTLGGRAAQHVETDAAGGIVVPWWKPAPVAPLFAISGITAEGTDGRAACACLRASARPSQALSVTGSSRLVSRNARRRQWGAAQFAPHCCLLCTL